MRVVGRDEFVDVLDEALSVLSVGQVACLMWRSVMNSIDLARYRDASAKKMGRWALNQFAGLVRYWVQIPEAVKVLKISPRGMTTTVAIGVMSGTQKHWYAVTLADVDNIIQRARGARATPIGWR